MRRVQYKDFSLKLHQRTWVKDRPNMCQFELTFGCPLHCQHCYSDCYNIPGGIKKELNTWQIIKILDKIYNSGVFWLCFTGGDPLARKDFLEIYTYAKKKGFIITIFTSGILINRKWVDFFKRITPFCIELTLNGVTQKTYEAITGVKGSFKKIMSKIFMLKKKNIPFKIKTLVTKQNIQELDKIEDFVRSLDLEFRPNTMFFARLNQDLTPCKLRLEPGEILTLNEKFNTNSMEEKNVLLELKVNTNLFRCAAGADTFHVDPYGNMFLCTTLRKPAINLLKYEISDGLKLFKQLKARKFKTNSKCKTCLIAHLCYRCPGGTYLETGDSEAPVDYFCRLAHLVAEKKYVYNQT